MHAPGARSLSLLGFLCVCVSVCIQAPWRVQASAGVLTLCECEGSVWVRVWVCGRGCGRRGRRGGSGRGATHRCCSSGAAAAAAASGVRPPSVCVSSVATRGCRSERAQRTVPCIRIFKSAPRVRAERHAGIYAAGTHGLGPQLCGPLTHRASHDAHAPQPRTWQRSASGGTHARHTHAPPRHATEKRPPSSSAQVQQPVLQQHVAILIAQHSVRRASRGVCARARLVPVR